MIAPMSAPLDPAGPASPTDSPITTARRLLTDPSRCPSCGSRLPGSRCPVCGVDLSGAAGRQVWQLSVRAAQTLTEREAVLTGLRGQAAPARPTRTAAPVVPSAATPSLGPPSGFAAPASAPLPPTTTTTPPPPPPVRPPAPRPPGPPAASGLGIHGLLVGVGALLLAVAAVGFLVFSWRGLPLAGRAIAIGGATVGVLAVASWLRSRLPQTAEAVGALAVVLVLSDCWAVRRTGLLGADRLDGLGYAAGALAVSALLLGGWAVLSKVRAGSIAAAGLLPLAVVLLAARLDGDLGPVPVPAVGFLVAALIALGRSGLARPWRAERGVLRAVAATALLAAATPAALGEPGSGRAALILTATALAAVGQAFADRARPGSAGLGGSGRLGGSGPLVRPGTSVLLRRSWSLAAGLAAGTAALQAGIALADVTGLGRVPALILVTAGPALLLAAVSIGPARFAHWGRPGAAVRRSAFAAGLALVAGLAAAPVLLLAGWLPVRAAAGAVPAWSATPSTPLADLGPDGAAEPLNWLVALLGLIAFGAGTAVAGRWGRWPAWLRRPLTVAAGLAAGLVVLVLPLVPAAPVVAVVAGLVLVSAVSALVVEVRPTVGRFSGPVVGHGVRLLAALSGLLAVVLAWSTLELSAPLTLAGAAGLLAARRVGPDRSGAPGAIGSGPLIRSALAGLAALALPFAVVAVAAQAGAGPSLRLVWAGLIGGLGAAALLGLPGWWPRPRPDRPGRARWSAADRLVTAVPLLVALVVGLLATLPSSGPGDLHPVAGGLWARPVLLAVALLLALTAAVAVRPAIAGLVPVVPVGAAALAPPLLGGLLSSLRPVLPGSMAAGLPDRLIWAIAAAVSAVVVSALVLSRSGAAAQAAGRRAAEFGAAAAGLVALGLVNGIDSLWPVLLVLGAAAAALATAPDRRAVGLLAGLLLTGSSWARLAGADVHLVEAYSLPPAAVLLVLAGYRLRRDRSADPVRLLVPGAGLAFTPSIVAAAGGGPLRPVLLIGAAAGLALAGVELRRRGIGARLVVLLVTAGGLVAGVTAVVRSATAAGHLDRIGGLGPAGLPLDSVELWTGPAALIVLLAGTRLMTSRGASGLRHAGESGDRAGSGPAESWIAYGPGLALLLLPGLLAGTTQAQSPQARQFVLLALAGLVLVVGVLRRLQAPVVLGAIVLTVQALILLTPWIGQLPTVVPVWGWIGAIGLGLLLLGARYEQRLRQLRSFRLRLAALR